MGTVGVVAFIAVLTVTIVFHEFGHYWTAKRFGMKVEAFFFGFGPKLFSKKKGETEYGVRLLPFGGYVKITGMNPFVEVDPADEHRTFGAKPAWQRAIVLAAGSTTHFILSIVMVAFLYGALGIPQITTTIEELTKGEDEQPMPAATAGIEPGDEIVAIDSEPVEGWGDVVTTVRRSPGEELTVTVLRDSERLSFTLVPEPVEVELQSGETTVIGQMGVKAQVVSVRQAPHEAVITGVTRTGQLIGLSVVGIKELFSPGGLGQLFQQLGESGRREVGGNELIGIVGAGQIAGQVAAAGLDALIEFLAAVVVFIGVINLVPLPVLDGGYLAILGYEKITRRSVDLRKLVPIGVAVLALLLFLSLALLYLDIARPLDLPR